MLRPCLVCGQPTEGTRCPAHEAEHRSRRDRGRAPRTDAYAVRSYRWRKVSERARKASPWCEWCGSGDDLTVDHRVPLSLGGDEWDPENHRVLCRPCHGRAAATQRGV